MASVDLLHKGHHCYMDNYYSSPELFWELYDAETYACGSVQKKRKGLPIAVSSAKLKKGESVFRRNDALLALKQDDKHAIYMITTIHDAKMVDISIAMREISSQSQLSNIFHKWEVWTRGILHRSVKWWRKLFVHMLDMLMLNAFILHNKFATEKNNP